MRFCYINGFLFSILNILVKLGKNIGIYFDKKKKGIFGCGWDFQFETFRIVIIDLNIAYWSLSSCQCCHIVEPR